MDDDREKLEKIYQRLNEEEDTFIFKNDINHLFLRRYYYSLYLCLFLHTKVNTDKSIIDLISIVAVGGLLVLGGIF